MSLINKSKDSSLTGINTWVKYFMRPLCWRQCSAVALSVWVVKIGLIWIFPSEWSHGNSHCDNRLPAERSKSQSSVPATACMCISMCVSSMASHTHTHTEVWSGSFLISVLAVIRVSAAGLSKNSGWESVCTFENCWHLIFVTWSGPGSVCLCVCEFDWLPLQQRDLSNSRREHG